MAGDTRVYWLLPTAAIFISIVVLIVVAIVQYAHLRIANQSVVIDLYERRMSAYAQIDKSVQSVMNKGEATHDDLYQFVVAQTGARFLFGQDVRSYLQDLREHLAWLVTFNDVAIDESPEAQQLSDEKFERMKRFVSFFDTSSELFAPYLCLDQKHTPFWRPW
jgi:hypothetical protein